MYIHIFYIIYNKHICHTPANHRMAEAASVMPVDFRTSPELAYYKLGGEMDTCRLITGTWQLDGKHGYHPFFMCVRAGPVCR
jgi:hypothetical protein